VRTHLTYSAYVELNENNSNAASALEPKPRMRVRILMAAKVLTGPRSPGKPWQQKNYSYFGFKPYPNESLVSPPFWDGDLRSPCPSS